MTQTTAAIPTKEHGDSLPWPLIGAVLASMSAMYLTGGGFIGLPVMAMIIVASRFVPWRLPRSRVISWGLRAGIIAAVIMVVNQQSGQDTNPWYLKQEDTNLAGYALAAELALRSWERRQPATAREWLGVFVLLSALILAAATNTYRRPGHIDHIQVITPIYCLLILLSLRSLTRIGQPLPAAKPLRDGLVALRAIVVLITLGFAFSAVYGVTRYEYQMTSWAMKMFPRTRSQRNEIGFSTTPRLSAVANPEPSTDRLLLIDGRPTEQHLRVMAFDTYKNRQWLPLLNERTFHPAVLTTAAGQAASSDLTFTLMGDTADLLPAPLQAQRIDADQPLEEDDQSTLRETQPMTTLQYQLKCPSAPAFQGALCTAPDANSRQRLLAIPPELDPKVVELSRSVAGAGEPAKRLFRITTYLQSHHQYSLSFDPQGEPLSDFILNGRSAHCQYFASAVVMMARAVGIPARYVGGFYAHESYGTDQMVVRQRDAHAWAECFIDGTGWVTVDATPSGGRPDAVYQEISRWQRWREKLSDLPGRVRNWLSTRSAVIKMAVALGAAGMLGVWIVRRLIALRRRPKPDGLGYAAPSQELMELARRFDLWLKRRDMACPPQQTWREYLSQTDQAPSPREFVDWYDRARFGDGDGTATNRAKDALQTMENQMAGSLSQYSGRG